MTTGIVTAIPLLCFGAAAVRIPWCGWACVQYLAPILQFALGVFWYDEDMPAGRWLGFVLVWLALLIFTVEAVATAAASSGWPRRPPLSEGPAALWRCGHMATSP